MSHLLLEEGCLLARHLYFKQSQSLLSHAKATLHGRPGGENCSCSLCQTGWVASTMPGHDGVHLQPWSLSERPSSSLNPKTQKWMGKRLERGLEFTLERLSSPGGMWSPPAPPLQ